MKDNLIAGVDLGGSRLAIAYLHSDGRIDLETSRQGANLDRASQLRLLIEDIAKSENFTRTNHFFIEEPLVGRGIRASLQLAQCAGALMYKICDTQYSSMMLVPVGAWKKRVVGNGSANKEQISSWLRTHEPAYYDKCRGDQDLIDATCIALYGREVNAQSRSLELT